jgi:protein tyrosine/serine phosphatase
MNNPRRKKNFKLGLKKISLAPVQTNSEESSQPQQCVNNSVSQVNNDNVFKITSHLFMSGYECASSLDCLKTLGIDHIINLTAHKTQNLFEDQFDYSSYSINDTCNYDLSAIMDQIIIDISQRVATGKRVLIHCKMGISRAPSVILAFMIRMQGKSYNSAFDELSLINPKISPNVGFLIYLQEL